MIKVEKEIMRFKPILVNVQPSQHKTVNSRAGAPGGGGGGGDYGGPVGSGKGGGLITNNNNGTNGGNRDGGGVLLTNIAGVATANYVLGNTVIPFNPSSGLTISCWINTTGVANRIMRIFDIEKTVGNSGISIDISGTNMIYSNCKL